MLDETEEGTSSTISSSFLHKNDIVDIYSNSWGYKTEGKTFGRLSDLENDAIETGIKEVVSRV